MADRAVNVRLGVDNSSARRGVTQSEADFRRLGVAATAAGAEQQSAFTRAATVSQSAFERTAAVAQASGRATQESVLATSTSLGRLAVSAEEVPATFASAATVSSRAMGELATSTAAAASSVVASEARMSEATLASATGIQHSLAMRLAAGEAVMAQQGAMAAETSAASATQTSALTRAAATVDRTDTAFSALRTSGLAMLAMFAAASVTAAKFEKAMSGVAAVADTDAASLAQLRDAALEAGRATSFTASQAADAEGELARAGVSVADILGGALRGALSLAAAGQLDLSEAATISAQSMNTFGLRGKDVAHIADVLAAGANKSAADVHGLGESLRMGGLLAHQTGLSLEDTVGTLSAFADHALIGSDAGTSLKTMLQRLTPQSDEARGMMDKLGFSAYDAQGEFVGLDRLAGNMKRSFSDLTPEARNAAMGVIFGSDAVRAATILYEQGATGISHYRTEVDDSGAASRMAAVQLDNLSGDVEALGGSLEVALIQSGTEANKVLRTMVEWVTRLVNAYTDLPSWAQTSAVAILGVGGALAFTAASLLLVLPRIATFQTSMTVLAETMPRLAGAARGTMSLLGGPFGAILGIASAAIAVFGLVHSDAKQQVQGLTDAVKADGAAIGANTKAWLAHELETRGVLKAATELGLSTSDLTDAILGNADAATRTSAALQAYRDQAAEVASAGSEAGGAQDDLAKSLVKVDDVLQGLSPEIGKSVDAAKREAEAAGAAAGSTKALGDASVKTADELGDTRSEAEKLTDTLGKLNGANISAAEAAMGMQSSLAGLLKEVHDSGTGLDITTEKGRAVKGAFLDAAKAATAHAEAVQKQTGSTEQANIVLGEDIQALKDTMTQAGFTQQQIETLTSAYANVPKTATTQVTDPGALQTIADLQDIRKKVEDVPPGKSITVKAPSADALRDLEIIGYTVEHLKDGQVKVTVPASDAFDGTTRIQSYINSITGRTVHVNIDGSVNIPGSMGWRMSAQADGGIVGLADGAVTAAASGFNTRQAGVSNRAILWAEAGPEAYIPLDPAKRARSTALLGQVAGDFGYQLVPVARDLIPARQLVSAPVPAGAGSGGDRTTNITLNGARQSGEEQLADLTRRLAFVG